MKVTVHLMLKERVEGDDASLFTIENVVRAMKLRVVLAHTQASINKIKTLNSSINYDDRNAIGAAICKNPNANDSILKEIHDQLIYSTHSLKDIPQMSGLIGDQSFNTTSVSEKFLLNLDKEVASDGTIVYNIPYTIPSFTIPAEKNGTKLKNLSVFAATFVDYEELIQLSPHYNTTTEMFVSSKKDQFALLGYNDEDLVNNLDIVADEFEAAIAFHSTGVASYKDILKDGSLVKSKKVFIFSDPKFPTKYGKKYHGPVHFHGPYNPGPNGYQGYMAGDANVNHNNYSKLVQTNEECIGEVLDYRNNKMIEELVLNYSDFGFDDTFKEFTQVTFDASSGNSVTQLQEKETQSNAWLKMKQEQVISEPDFALRPDGSCSFIFTLNMYKILAYNTPFPGLLSMLPAAEIENIFSSTTIEDIKIFRVEVSRQSDDLGSPYLDETEQAPVMIVQGSETGGILSGLNTNSDGETLGQIQHLEIYEGQADTSKFFKHLAVRDSQIKLEDNDQKRFQYKIELKMSDPVVEYIKNKIDSHITPLKRLIQDYYQFAIESHNNFNIHTNTFTQEFRTKFQKSVYASNTPASTINSSFENGPIAIGINSFLIEILAKFQKLSTEQITDLATYMYTLIHPAFGNPDGINVVLKNLELFEKKFLDLLDIFSSTSGFKHAEYAEDTQSDKMLAKGKKEPANSITINQLLKGSFDNNSSGNLGYLYFNDTASNNTTVFRTINPSLFTKRFEIENQRIGANDIQTGENINIAGVVEQYPRYLAPIFVKTYQGKREIGTPEDIDTLIEVLESKSERDLPASAASGIGNFPNVPDIELPNQNTKSLKPKIPNLIAILQNSGVTLASKNQSLPLVYKSSAAIADIDFQDIGETPVDLLPEKIKKLATDYHTTTAGESTSYFPSGVTDASRLLTMLMIMQKLDMHNAYKIAVKFAHKGVNQNHLPNHIKKLGTDYESAAAGDSAKEYAAQFDNFTLAATRALMHNNIMELEYFDGFGTPGKFDFLNIKAKKFKPLTNSDLYSLKSQNKKLVLVRLKTYDDFDVMNKPDSVKLPVFNECFLLQI